MKTTLNLDDQLVARAKALAARNRTTLTRLIEEGLQLRLRRQPGGEPQGPIRLPVFRGTGVVPGVDACSNRSMREAAGDEDA